MTEISDYQVLALATILHLAQRSGELRDSDFKKGFDAAIEEAGAYVELEASKKLSKVMTTDSDDSNWLQEVFDRAQETLKNSDDWRKQEEPEQKSTKGPSKEIEPEYMGFTHAQIIEALTLTSVVVDVLQNNPSCTSVSLGEEICAKVRGAFPKKTLN